MLNSCSMAVTNKAKAALFITLLGCVLMASGCSGKTQTALSTTESIPPAVEYWQKQFPDNQLIKWAENDLNNDKRKDAVMIYRQADDSKCKMVIAINLPDGYSFTDPIAAPVSSQQISFTDFDNKPPTEVVISGKSGTFIGIGIFRLVDAQIVNLFADGYDKCCE